MSDKFVLLLFVNWVKFVGGLKFNESIDVNLFGFRIP